MKKSIESKACQNWKDDFIATQVNVQLHLSFFMYAFLFFFLNLKNYG